jgi:ATP-dependent Clp protease ATP-binding subunit ClpA
VLSNELENCLKNVFHQAREALHEYLTVEHLLLAILEAPKVQEILCACGSDLAQLKQQLQDHLNQWIPRLKDSDKRDPEPSVRFQRVLQRAVFHVQSGRKKEVGVGDVLVQIFSEKQTYAVNLLDSQRVTRPVVIKYVSARRLSETGHENTDPPADCSRLRPRQLVQAWVEAFNRGDLDALASFYSEDAVNHQVAESVVHGRENLRQVFASGFASTKMHCIVENVFEEGEWAILEWRDRSGLRGCGFFHVVDGRIKFQRGYWDKLSFLRLHGLPIPKRL